jgi:archaellin
MASEIKVDTISEKTAANGVSIDGVVLKDNEMGSTYLSDGLVLLKTGNSGGSGISLDDFTDSTKYSHYYIVGKDIVPASDGANFRMRFRSSGGSDIIGTYYSNSISWGNLNNAAGGDGGQSGNTSTTDYVRPAVGDVGTASGESLNFVGWFNGYKTDRQSAYASIQDQLDMQYWDNVNGTTTWKDHIAQVKSDNPKP